MSIFEVYCDDQLVELNGVTRLFSLYDAKSRAALHAGYTMGKRALKGDPLIKLFGSPPSENGEWPWEINSEGSYCIMIFDLYYEIRIS